MPSSENEDDAGQAGESGRTRVRVTKACNLCYKHRVRCELPSNVPEGEPLVCDRCARLKLVCAFNREQKKRGPKRNAEDAGLKKRKTAGPSKLKSGYGPSDSEGSEEFGQAELKTGEITQVRQRNEVLEGILRRVLLSQPPDAAQFASALEEGSEITTLGLEFLRAGGSPSPGPSLPPLRHQQAYNPDPYNMPGQQQYIHPQHSPPQYMQPHYDQYQQPQMSGGYYPNQPWPNEQMGYPEQPAYPEQQGYPQQQGLVLGTPVGNSSMFGFSPNGQPTEFYATRPGFEPGLPPAVSPPNPVDQSQWTMAAGEASSEEAARTMAALAHGGQMPPPQPQKESRTLTTASTPSTVSGSNQLSGSDAFDFTPDRLPPPQMTVAIFSKFIAVTTKQLSLVFPVLHTQTLLAKPYACLPLANAILGAVFRSAAFFTAARAGVLESLVDRFTTPTPDILAAAYISFFDIMSTGLDIRFTTRVITVARLIGMEIVNIDKLLSGGTMRVESPVGTPGSSVGSGPPKGTKLLTGLQKETVRRCLWGMYVMDKVMCHAALKPPIVTAADMSDIALPAPESVWTSPVHDYDEQLEEQRWSRAKQMSGAQFFAWKDERGTLQKMAPTMTPLHHHILIANLNEWIDGILIHKEQGGPTFANKEAIAAALRDYYATFLAPYATPVDRGIQSPTPFSPDIPSDGADFVLTAPRNNGLATTMMLFYNYFQMFLCSPVGLSAVFSSPEWFLSPSFPIALQHTFSNTLLLEQTMVWDPELESIDPTILMPLTQATACYIGLMKKLGASKPVPVDEIKLTRGKIGVMLEAARKLSRFMATSKQLILILEGLLADEPGEGASAGANGEAPNPWLQKHIVGLYFGQTRPEDEEVF